ncbi:MAG: SufD family Fe-S cluster assembly protein [Bacteroidales bacterium]|nr:SufD family Fe-S cluster assembly protein [Bacteroidales bacterium]
MEDLIVARCSKVHRIYVLGGRGTCCSDDPRLPGGRHPLAGQHPKNQQIFGGPGGGTSSPQSSTTTIPQQIVVEGDAKVDIVVLVYPGVSCDVKLDVHLVGEGAEANIYGAYVCGGDEKVKIAVDMHHDVPHCNSRQLFKGIAGGRSRVDFYGKIIVAQDAQRTEAYQENHNILLSDEAKVDTKPQLEIYADDVKCSHGATIGRLNEEEQFYMRSRGISLEDAKVLQMISFIAPVLENIQDEAQRETFAAEFESDIRNIIRGL